MAVVRCLATTGGANIELVTNHGLTPAMVAANSAQHQVVEYLLDLIKSKTSTDSEQVWRSLMHFYRVPSACEKYYFMFIWYTFVN